VAYDVQLASRVRKMFAERLYQDHICVQQFG
jgi:hypothetical protein